MQPEIQSKCRRDLGTGEMQPRYKRNDAGRSLASQWHSKRNAFWPLLDSFGLLGYDHSSAFLSFGISNCVSTAVPETALKLPLSELQTLNDFEHFQVGKEFKGV